MARIKQTAAKSHAGSKSKAAALAAKSAKTGKTTFVQVKKDLQATPASQATKARAKRK